MNKLILVFSAFAILSTATPVFANCKAEVDAATKAQSERDTACDIAALPAHKKTLKQIRQGDSVCKKKHDKHVKAAAKLQACAAK